MTCESRVKSGGAGGLEISPFGHNGPRRSHPLQLAGRLKWQEREAGKAEAPERRLGLSTPSRGVGGEALT
ncbi:Hypothetical protein NTJ_09235 [Nesidiocoris tenuis]|uniref:Uncharacterized protein n=1 Tax=Nesidiocoris tenuis TaxID=355587 RepID=A0ABN7AY08_9HEMI|nr:Hypothetical protein NTJ_09235 [Nesidiocoris tenuis]